MVLKNIYELADNTIYVVEEVYLQLRINEEKSSVY